MRAVYRCGCGRVLCALEEKDMLVKRDGLLVVVPLGEGPAFIRCYTCHSWHKLNNSRIMEPMTQQEAVTEVGRRCIQCGSLLEPNQEECPLCGQPQTLTNHNTKQTRS